MLIEFAWVKRSSWTEISEIEIEGCQNRIAYEANWWIKNSELEPKEFIQVWPIDWTKK